MDVVFNKHFSYKNLYNYFNFCYNYSGDDMEKTKVIATIGPSSESKDILRQMIRNGVDVIRINMSYETHDHCQKIIELVRELNEELKTYVAIMLDTNGNNITIDKLAGGSATLQTDDKIRIYKNKVLGDSTKFSTNFPSFVDETRIGNILKINDGLIELEVIDKKEDCLLCLVVRGGEIKDGRKIIVPNVTYSIPFLNERDYNDIVFACENDVDFLALSNVRSHDDVLNVNDILIENNNDHLQIISKIETREALDYLDDIINVSDGTMVARGDLGVELPIERVPSIQKMIINKCHNNGKISIVATEMMSSMTHEMRPTRAEVSDVANAVLDGADAVMLSGETTVGDHPVETLVMMAKILASTEENIDYLSFTDKAMRTETENITGIIAYNVATAANRLEAKLIVTPTLSGLTARKISRFRPKCLILAPSPDLKTIKSLALNFGVVPIYVNELNSLDKLMNGVTKVAKKNFDLTEDDKIIVTGSYPFKDQTETNFMQITKI